MKKSIAILFISLALVLLLSPGIIGRLAEQSIEQSFGQAAQDSGEVIISSTGFERGWFSSAGRHRIELLEGELYYLLFDAAEFSGDSLPALIIDTRLDHGLVPFSSMRREHGSLLPGLGSAISHLSLELADGSLLPLPGTLYSHVGIFGKLQSRFVLQADSFDGAESQLDWGSAEFLLSSDPRAGSVGVQGALQSLAIQSAAETIITGKISVDLLLAESGYGFMVGPAELTFASMSVIGDSTTNSGGPFHMRSDSSINDERLDATLQLQLDGVPLPQGGAGSVQLAARLENTHAAALGRVKRDLDASRASDPAQLDDFDLEADLMQLLAGGMALHIDQLDISGPFGAITSRFSATLLATPADPFSWAAALLALDVSADVSLPAALVNAIAPNSSEMQAAIDAGVLVPEGDYFVMKALFRKGLLNVNGTPMPIPLMGLN